MSRGVTLTTGALGRDSWFLSPRRPAGSLLCDSDVYHSFSCDLVLLRRRLTAATLCREKKALRWLNIIRQQRKF